MNFQINHIIVLLMLVFSMGCSSCAKITGPAAKDGVNHVCYLDISSSDTANLNLRLADLRDKLLSQLGPKDALLVMAIDKASLTAAIPLFKLDLATKRFDNPAFPPTIKGAMAEKAKVAFLDSVARSFPGIIKQGLVSRMANNQKTDILGALRQAAQYVKPERFNRLYLLSDMLNDSEELNLDGLRKQRADLNKAMASVSPLDLPYEEVIVFTGDNSTIEALDFAKIQACWRSYFTKCGVRLSTYTSGGMILDLARNEAIVVAQPN